MRFAFLASTLIIASLPAVAATSAAADEIVVTANRDGYAAKRSATATKTDTDLILVPQSVNVVTAKQISDQAMHSIGDVLRTVPRRVAQRRRGPPRPYRAARQLDHRRLFLGWPARRRPILSRALQYR